ncbi:ATP-dependent metallopeptidase FtsH/Yme1/Tma family protein [Candidatus Sneabacter namystus]|uniref:ATP-dependent zinc metalloprotease FtsH n=1 Tax=Candidatus Sneabacter namystus TaxID=2601646 RepID=A0A5C0UKY2_9RICK|nr:ATP-dependent metallopeptidase FtsH/Yme1/Tma family protein [Candidatus Sneabacter namystus]
MKNNQIKNLVVWAGVVFATIVLFNLVRVGSSDSANYIVFSEFLECLDSKQVKKVKIQGRHLEGQFVDGRKFRTYSPEYQDLVRDMKKNNVVIEVVPLHSRMSTIVGILLSWVPMIVMAGIWIFFMRQMHGAGGKALGFGKSKVKLMSDKGNKVTFADVAGIDEAKEELMEVVDFLRDPGKFRNLGGNIPKGCLLIGPPGTGKTLLARAIAGEANAPFFSISGSDFVEMFVGVGASRVRDMFEKGKKHAPCIIFIDEIDAVGRYRGIGLGGGNDEREQTLNQLLVEMDGFEFNEGVVIIAATNRPDVLDPALLRPGRFDRKIAISYPDIEARVKIINVHLKKVKHDTSVDAKILARGTPGFSGAELANLVNEGALLAAKHGKSMVDMSDLENARDRVLMGAERRSMVIPEEERLRIAYHESGHALVSLYVRSKDPIHKVTIIPRGHALGMVMRLPEDDKVLRSMCKMESDIAVAMGGRAAEEIIYGNAEVTTGASNDLKVATGYARSMVSELGMSKKVGPIFYANSEDMYVKEGGSKISEYMSTLIDQEVKRFLEEGYTKAEVILREHIDELHAVAKVLVEKETLTGEEVASVIKEMKNDANAA